MERSAWVIVSDLEGPRFVKQLLEPLVERSGWLAANLCDR
jgi:hypothetical protein